MDPILVVLLFASLAAVVGGLGGLPLGARQTPPAARLGWANAVAGGTMLGAAYMLTSVEAGSPAATAAGAALGILFIHGTHRAMGTADLDLNRLDSADPVYAYRVLLVNSLHAASEGVAIGVAMRVDLAFGILLALALALHNIPEAMALAAVLRGGGAGAGAAAGLAVVANVNQILLAVATFAVASAAPGFLPWALGFAVGALAHLVMAELFAQAYRQTGQTSIAVAAVAALGMVVLAQELIR